MLGKPRAALAVDSKAPGKSRYPEQPASHSGFVGETHHTIDERRRAAIHGWRPSSPALLTVVEGAMGTPLTGTNMVVEQPSSLSSFDAQRDDNVVAQVAAA